MERLLTSNVSISNGKIKYPIRKSIFAVNLPLKKIFPAAVANADIGSLMSLHTVLRGLAFSSEGGPKYIGGHKFLERKTGLFIKFLKTKM